MPVEAMIERALTLACGTELPNRLCKAAMTEGLADAHDRPTRALCELYGRWAAGGAALLLTGNIMIDRRYLERGGNVVVDDERDLERLRDWVASVRERGGRLWAQISHPGRQCPRLVNAEPLAPSVVPLDLLANYGRPRAATQADIADVIERFARTAGILQAAGMDGVEIHAAHGYLISQFLSARTNLRTDEWGGTPDNRARLLRMVVRAVRERVGPRFPVAVKLNSADFTAGGFTLEESVEVVRQLNTESVDLIEVSGGTYEQIEFFRSLDEREMRATTRAREALFLTYAESIKAVARMPIMVTGGFRTRAGMDAALASGATDLIGLARPFCLDPQFPARLLAGTLDRLPVPDHELVLGRGYWGQNSPSATLRALNALAHAAWYYEQLDLLAAGRAPEPQLRATSALVRYLAKDTARVLRRKLV